MPAETRALLNPSRPDAVVTFAAVASTAEYAVSTEADNRVEGNGELIVRMVRSRNVSVTGSRSELVLVEDDDVPEIGLELRVAGKTIVPQGDVLRVEINEAEQVDVQVRAACPTSGSTTAPSAGGSTRFGGSRGSGTCVTPSTTRPGASIVTPAIGMTRGCSVGSGRVPTTAKSTRNLVSWDSGDRTNDVNSSHPPRPVAVDPDRISFGSCDDEYCARYTIGSPSRTEIQARNANPLIAIEAPDEEVEEGEAAQFRLTRLWPEDR